MRTSADIVEMYDRQAGTYVEAMANPDYASLKGRVGRKLANIVESYEPFNLLDAGVGEATTLAAMLGAMGNKPSRVAGFDASLKRLDVARNHLRAKGLTAALFQASLSQIPMGESSFDVVTTFHSIEPNRGREKEIIKELFRVTRKALVMVEPCYEIASSDAKARMDSLGYVTGLYEICTKLGFMTSREPWELDANPDNPAALYIVEK